MSGQPAEQRTVVKPTASKYVKLNVGGALFNTTIGTLTKQDSMLRAMFSGRMEVLTDSEGELSSNFVFFWLCYRTAVSMLQQRYPTGNLGLGSGVGSGQGCDFALDV